LIKASENKEPVILRSQKAFSSTVQTLTAMQDVEFFNSMIEAVNKQIKYRFLYHQHIPDAAALALYLQKAIDDYNNRPHLVLNNPTPLEVLTGKMIDPSVNREMAHRALIAREQYNKKATCFYSF
jgi:putative transposase